jgi:hypothetical protein
MCARLADCAALRCPAALLWLRLRVHERGAVALPAQRWHAAAVRPRAAAAGEKDAEPAQKLGQHANCSLLWLYPHRNM